MREVRRAEAGEGRPPTPHERRSFYAQLLGQGLFCYPFAWDDLGAYHRLVLTILRTIPPGTTRSYAWVAQASGRPKAWRSVGRAMAGNPFPILFPCHRVVYADGSLGPYGFGGPSIKAALLDWEAARLAEGFVP